MKIDYHFKVISWGLGVNETILKKESSPIECTLVSQSDVECCVILCYHLDLFVMSPGTLPWPRQPFFWTCSFLKTFLDWQTFQKKNFHFLFLGNSHIFPNKPFSRTWLKYNCPFWHNSLLNVEGIRIWSRWVANSGWQDISEVLFWTRF